MMEERPLIIFWRCLPGPDLNIPTVCLPHRLEEAMITKSSLESRKDLLSTKRKKAALREEGGFPFEISFLNQADQNVTFRLMPE